MVAACGMTPSDSVGCAGTIEQFLHYGNGRYDIALHGTQRVRIEAGVSHESLACIDDATFVNVLGCACPFIDSAKSTPQKQALIEVDDIGERFEALVEMFRCLRVEPQSRRVPNSGVFQ